MKYAGLVPAIAAALAMTLVACDRAAPPRNHTAVMGGSAPSAAQGTLTDAKGRAIPPPGLPPGTTAQVARSGEDGALAVWVQDGRVVSASYAPATGWSTAQPLEQIYGTASEPQLASNGRGIAMAVWRHTVGSIQSLRFSRYEPGAGWSLPDVLPGALPRPRAEGAPPGQNAPHLEMDAKGNVLARWPSGFSPDEVQVARYVDGQGWTRAESQQAAAAPAPAAAASR